MHNFGDIRSRNPRFTLFTIAPFVAIWQKSSSHQISQNILDLSTYFTGLVDILLGYYPNVRLVVAQGTLLWQLVKFRGWSQTLPGTTLLLAPAFNNGLVDLNLLSKDYKWQYSGYNNLVNFGPIIWEFMLSKCTNFATIRQQFDNDLHSLPWHSNTDYKITMLILEESPIISVHIL